MENTLKRKFRAIPRIESSIKQEAIYFTLEDLIRHKYTFQYPEHYHFSESTGLLDKNGKEICEGDILKTESGRCHVKWYDKGACFRWMFEGNSESPLNYDDREIIGNIYENPELVK